MDLNNRKMKNHPQSPVSTIQYGYRKCGTHELVFSKHLSMGTAIMKETEEEGKKRREEEWREAQFSLVGKGLLMLGLVSPSRTEFSFVHL